MARRKSAVRTTDDGVTLEPELALTERTTAELRRAVEQALAGIAEKNGATVVVVNVSVNFNVGKGSQIALPGSDISNVIEAEHVAAFGGKLKVSA